jgi:DNA-binding transcriptional LysR family regulator
MARKLDVDSQIGRRLRLRDLHLFFTVVERRSMAKAAAHLGMSQPAVSEVIANLEATLGVRLFDRQPQGVVPTVFGRALLRRGEAAFDELKQGIRDIAFLADPSVGEIHIGCPESIAASILPAIVERLVAQHPRVELNVTQVSTATFDFPELRRREFDLVLARLDAPPDRSSIAEDLDVETLFVDRVVLAAGRDSPWARRRKVTLAELHDAPWILTPSATINTILLEEAFRTIGMALPRINLVTFSIHLRTHLLATGNFVTALPQSTVRLNAQRFGLKELPIALPVRPWPVAIVTLRHRTLSPVVERFIEFVRSFARQMPGHPSGTR